MGKGAFPALIHCFTASQDFAEKVLTLGLYPGAPGAPSSSHYSTPLNRSRVSLADDEKDLETGGEHRPHDEPGEPLSKRFGFWKSTYTYDSPSAPLPRRRPALVDYRRIDSRVRLPERSAARCCTSSTRTTCAKLPSCVSSSSSTVVRSVS